MSIENLLKHAHEGNAVEFESTFNNLMMDRIQSKVDERTNEVATNMFGEDDEEL